MSIQESLTLESADPTAPLLEVRDLTVEFPGGLLVLIVLAVNLVGDGLRDALDPSSGSASA